MKNYYKILMISPEAPQEMVVKAYRVLARGYHPDRNPPGRQKWAEEKMKELNEAYEVLSNPAKRAAYDQRLLQQRVKAQPANREPTTTDRPAAADAEHVKTGDAESDWNAWGREYFDRKEDFLKKAYPASMAEPGHNRKKGKGRSSRWRRGKKPGGLFGNRE